MLTMFTHGILFRIKWIQVSVKFLRYPGPVLGINFNPCLGLIFVRDLNDIGFCVLFHIPYIWLNFTADMVVQIPCLQGVWLQGYLDNSHCTMTIPHECNLYELVMSHVASGGKDLRKTWNEGSVIHMWHNEHDKVVKQYLLEGCEVGQPSRSALIYAIINLMALSILREYICPTKSTSACIPPSRKCISLNLCGCSHCTRGTIIQ